MEIKDFVSTHSRLKAAGPYLVWFLVALLVSTHSRLKAAGNVGWHKSISNTVSTHSRLKAAGSSAMTPRRFKPCFNTQPPKGGWGLTAWICGTDGRFQHTAA